MLCLFKNNNSNINIYNTNNNKMRKSNVWEFHSHTLRILKLLSKTMAFTPKRVTKVTEK